MTFDPRLKESKLWFFVGFHPLPGLEEERLVDEYFDTSDSFELMKNDFW